MAMLVHNITTKLSWRIEKEWLQWHKENYIPEVLRTELISDHKIFRLLDQEDDEGPTFTTQLFFATMEKYEEYIRLHSPGLRNKAIDKWGNESISFHTVMQLVN